MKKIMLFIILTFLFQLTYSQKKGKSKSPAQLKLDSVTQKLSGVKFAKLLITEDGKQILNQNEGFGVNDAAYQVIIGFKEYFETDLKIPFIISNEQDKIANNSSTSVCDFIYISYYIGPFERTFMALGNYQFEVTFHFCDFSTYTFKRTVSVDGNTKYNKKFRGTLLSIIFEKPTYNYTNKLKLKSNPFVINFKDFNTYLDTCKSLNKYEGIFNFFDSDNPLASEFKIGIYNNKGVIQMIYFNGTTNKDDWFDGELRGVITSTKSESDFLLELYTGLKFLDKGSLSFKNENLFEYRFKDAKHYYKYIRLR